MKIIQLIGRYNKGGTASWLNVLISSLRDSGHSVDLYSGYVTEGESEDPKFQDLGGLHFELSARSISPIYDTISIFKFRKILKDEKPVVLNTHTTKAGWIGRISAIGLPIKVCHTYHGHLLYGYFSTPVTYFYVLMERILARYTDVFIVVGEKVGQELLENGIGEKYQYQTIYPAVNNLNFVSKKTAREVFGLDDEFVVGWLGRITEIKRPDVLTQIALALPDVTFLIGGEGNLNYKVEENLIPNIRWVGWADPAQFWPACDLALLTSDNEGLPTSLVEASLAGIPIIAHDVGAVSEVFEDQKGGILISEFSKYLESIEEFNKGRVKRTEFSSNVRKFAASRFSKENFLKGHESAYK